MGAPPRLALLYFAVLLSLSAPTSAHASPQPAPPEATDPALAELLRLALSNSPQIKALRAGLSAAEQVPSQRGALPDPSADIELMNIPTDGSAGSTSLTRGVSVGLTQALPFPGKRRLLADAARGEVDVEAARLAQGEQALRAEVSRAAFAYKRASELLRLNGQTADTLALVAQSVLARYTAGMGSQSDVLAAQSEITQIAVLRQDLESQRAIAKARVESLVAAPVEESLLEAVQLPAPSSLPTLEPLLDLAGENAPEVKVARASSGAAEARAEVAKQSFKPDFMVGGRYRFKDPSMGGHDALTAMVGMTLPFFHYRDRYRPGLDEAHFRVQSAREEASQAGLAARYALTEAYLSAQRDARVFSLYDRGLLLQARQTYAAALSAYGTGQTDFGALLLAVKALYAYEAEAVEARAEFCQRVAEMEALLGATLLEASRPTAPREGVPR